MTDNDGAADDRKPTHSQRVQQNHPPVNLFGITRTDVTANFPPHPSIAQLHLRQPPSPSKKKAAKSPQLNNDAEGTTTTTLNARSCTGGSPCKAADHVKGGVATHSENETAILKAYTAKTVVRDVDSNRGVEGKTKKKKLLRQLSGHTDNTGNNTETTTSKETKNFERDPYGRSMKVPAAKAFIPGSPASKRCTGMPVPPSTVSPVTWCNTRPTTNMSPPYTQKNRSALLQSPTISPIRLLTE